MNSTDAPDFIWQTWAALVAILHDAGIPLMIGTDLSVLGVIPGVSVHQEMAIWQEAGIPAADVLRSATIVPAEFMGVDDRLGTIEPGKTASMILLRANPLKDIANAAEIESVFEEKSGVVETVAVRRGGSGRWRPVAYFIR